MGKGDKKTAKGKRVIGSYGNVRKRKSSKTVVAASAKPAKVKTEKPAAEKKATTKKASTAKKTTTKKTSDDK
jgi:ribosomal small subunit protein bTHX